MCSAQYAEWAIGIASSTGGPQAAEHILARLPANLPAVVLISQHMPAEFTGPFARRLDRATPLSVVEAQGGEDLRPGCVFVAPGGFHLVVTKDRRTRLSEAPRVNFVRPAADVMMMSMAAEFGRRTIGVVLTGMGRDGTGGARAISCSGGMVIVQDPSEAQIGAMPRSVIADGLANLVLPVGLIGPRVARLLKDRMMEP